MHLYSLELQFARVQNPPKYIKIWLYIGLCIYQLRDQEEEYKNKLFLVFSSTVRTLTGSTIRMCYWCRALCQLLRIAVPSLSPSEAQGCGEAHTQQPSSHTPRRAGVWAARLWQLLPNLQPLPSSWSRSLPVGECWECSARRSVGWGLRCVLALGSSEHLPLLSVNNWILSLALAKRMED